VLRGFVIVYVNLDEVIRIIREYDDAKERMMKRWRLTELQADAILDMRLRALRRLEEIAIKRELEALGAEEKELTALVGDEKRQWKALAAEMADIKKEFGQSTALGKRRTEIGAPPAELRVPVEALIEREPVTVLCSAKGWIRTVKGHSPTLADLKYKEGDEGRFVLAAETTDKLLLFSGNGRFHTLSVDKLPGGRGHGEPVRLMVEIGNEEVVAILPYREGRKILVASDDGRGFVVPADEALGQTRSGKVVLTPAEGAVACVAAAVDGDMVAVVGDNHKLLVFPLAEIPEMARGRGVILQRYHDGKLADAKTFRRAEGLSWRQGETRTRTETELGPWEGARAQAGRLAPPGFPKSNKFG
jgi:topoisomerase IV subunit A